MRSTKSVMKIMMVMTLAAGVAFAGSHAVVAVPPDPGEFDVTSKPGQQGYNSGQGGNSSIVTECVNADGDQMSFADFMQAQDDLYQLKKSDPEVVPLGQVSCISTVVPTSKVNEWNLVPIPITSTVLGLGNLTSICDTSTQISLRFDIDVVFGDPQVGEIKRNYTTTPSNIKVASSGYQFCTWNMVFTDPKESRLSGTVESTTAISPKKANLSTKCENYAFFVAFCYQYSKSSYATVVGGSGYYEGQAGTGSWTVNAYAQVFCCDDNALTGGNASLASSIMADTWVRPEDVPSNSYITGQSVRPLASKNAVSLKFDLKKKQALSVVLVTPGVRSAKRTLTSGPWVKFVSAPGASCGLTVKTTNRSKSFAAQEAVDGIFVNFLVNRTWVKTNLGVSKGGKVDFVIKCSLGSKKSSTTKHVIIG